MHLTLHSSTRASVFMSILQQQVVGEEIPLWRGMHATCVFEFEPAHIPHNMLAKVLESQQIVRQHVS